MTADVVLMSDPRVTSVPVEECGEPLVDVRAYADGFLRVDAREAARQDTYMYLREPVAARLVQAEKQLPSGVHLLFLEGYRPPLLQRRYFEAYADTLRAAHPDWTADQVLTATSRYVSPPGVAPHSAGAAVDLTLVAEDGTELDLGTRVNATPEESAGACFTNAPVSSRARAHRDLLGGALGAAGLVNYPTEWWHWSYGDRYWARATGRPYALFGPRDLP
ncbi:M15 family metallopeptidase [Streptomyces fuscigenes]|uniref:M15 family metallopeptidase n=1 Tax=Streptomyces fuscigenes TaxID=1528880 RepID=UPI001F2F17EC|nr:M15 family metallopeptidase [Streptomyces fuscigenes]MCF3964533.1 D-alanyl-D-alanine carboxypeptidase family protein [Streptomyces fuscigenes]